VVVAGGAKLARTYTVRVSVVLRCRWATEVVLPAMGHRFFFRYSSLTYSGSCQPQMYWLSRFVSGHWRQRKRHPIRLGLKRWLLGTLPSRISHCVDWMGWGGVGRGGEGW
jgi:hypothetical protein